MKLLFLLLCILGPSLSLFAETEAIYRKQLQNNPRNINAYSGLIALTKTREQISSIGKEALQQIGPRSQIHTSLGNAYMNAKDYNSAVNAYRMALSLNPRSATAYNRLGLALLQINYFRQAEVAFKSALSFIPITNINSRIIYLTHLGIVFENLKEFEKANELITEVLTLNPNYKLALDTRNRLLQKSPS